MLHHALIPTPVRHVLSLNLPPLMAADIDAAVRAVRSAGAVILRRGGGQ